MNKQSLPKCPIRHLQIIFALLVGMACLSTTQAQIQTPAHKVEGRYLLIFDTASAMKKRLPVTQAMVNRLFVLMMNGQLQAGDTIGVWTFDRNLYAGQFPLQHWSPENAATIASNITTFIQQRHYSRSTHFEAVMPVLNRLIQESERLTVLIFCDGDGKIQGTPFDDTINAIFKQNQRAIGKAQQIFIVVLQTQFGQYTGYAVNSSDVGVNFPAFPTLPSTPQPAESVKAHTPSGPLVKINQPPPTPPPAVKLPPLVIIGTNVGTNLLPPTMSRPKLTSQPPTITASNLSQPSKPLNLTNTVLTNVPPTKVQEAPTNTPATAKENAGLSGKGTLAIAVVLLAAVGALTALLLRRAHKAPGGSFITRSMKKK